MREDHAGNIQDFLAMPEHATGYTLGFQRVIDGSTRWYRVRGELTSLNPNSVAGRPTPSLYTHSTLRQGHTHRGMMLGAPIGPGSDAQFLGFDVFTHRGRHGVFLERVRHDENTFHRSVAPIYLYLGRDVELSGGIENYLRLGPVDVRAGLMYSNRRNRHFRHCNRTGTEFENCQEPRFRDHNWHVPIGLVLRP
jgi:hypothetical protein